MSGLRERVKRRPVAWFFALAVAIELVVVALEISTGAIGRFGAAVEALGFENRTDFVALAQVLLAEPGAIPGGIAVVLQPLSPDIAAFVVAAIAFGAFGVGRILRGYRFWGGEVGWRRGLEGWGLMVAVFLGMSLVTAGLNRLFAPQGSFDWLNADVFSGGFLFALFLTLFLDIGGVTEETGWRGFALPLLQGRMTPLAATLVVGVLWGLWHFPARADILLGGYGLWGGVALLGILMLRFVFLSIVMTYFYNRVGGSTLIAIAMHGLHNDTMWLQGRILADGLTPYVVSELTLLAPIVTVAAGLLFFSGRKLGLSKGAREEAQGAVRPGEPAVASKPS